MILVAQETNIPGHLMVGSQDIYYSSLDAWKADLKKQAVAFDADSTSGDTASSAPTTMAPNVQSGQTTTGIKTNAANKSAVALPPRNSAAATDASAALQILLQFQNEMDTEKLAAAALTSKTGTVRVPNDTGSETAAALQTTSPRATSALSAGRLNQII